MRLKDIMTTNVRCVRRDETLTRAASIMQRRGIHHLVVAMAPASSACSARAHCRRGMRRGSRRSATRWRDASFSDRRR